MSNLIVIIVFVLFWVAAPLLLYACVQRKQRMREKIGWEPWIVYDDTHGMPKYFDNEDAAVRYAYRMSFKGLVQPFSETNS
jgi:hypothetical protein